MNDLIHRLTHYADVCAIPLFLATSVYLFQKSDKTIIEYLILLFVIIGFVADLIFTINYFW